MTDREGHSGRIAAWTGIRGLHLVLVTLLGLPLITPLLRRTVVPCTHDGHLHYHRVVAMLHAWKNGLAFSRWLPDLAFGYGYPFFLYREPLPLYLTLWPHLAGVPLPAAMNLFYVATILASGWFTYLWVRDVFGAPPAIVAAVAYMVAPYQLVDALVRGNQVESLALAFFPLLLWAGRRFMIAGTVRWFLVTTLGLAALALSHNISLLLFTPALALYLLVMGRLHGQEWPNTFLRLGLVFLLGLGLTSFYTGSALLEMDEVMLTLSTSNRNNDFHFNFASLGEIFAPVPTEDPTLINPPLLLRLGWVPSLLALGGLLSLAWNRRREQRAHVALMGAGALSYLLFALPLTEPLWETLPLIRFVQFPWRFVGRAALPVALLAGAPFAALSGRLGSPGTRLRKRGLHALLLAAAIALLVLEALPLLYPSYCREEPFPDIVDVHQYERNSGLVGVDPVGSYFPITVEERPVGSPLEEDYEAGRTPQRFDASILPRGASIQSTEYRTLGAEIELETPEAFQARYLTFAFPGWQVTVDGRDVPVTSSDPGGLITFPVPAGRHVIVVDWQLTPLRTFLAGTSLASALGLLAAALFLWRRPATQDVRGQRVRASLPVVPLFLMLALALLGAKLLLVDAGRTPLRRVQPPSVAAPGDLTAGGLRLAGYDLSRAQVPAGATFDIHMAWEVQVQPARALQSNVWLQGPEGLTWSEKETFRPRTFEEAPPTQQWLPGQWAWDSREVQVLPGTPPGSYQIVVTLFDLADLQPLTLERAGSGLGPTAIIGQVDVVRPSRPPQFAPQRTLHQSVEGLRLLGYNQDRGQAAPGDPVLLTLFWQRPDTLSSPLDTLSLKLRDSTGAVTHAWTIPPVRDEYPPGEWLPGERVRGQHLLRLPAALESGTYRFRVDGVALGQITVTAPRRIYVSPGFDHALGETFGGRARLEGYSLAPLAGLESLKTAAPETITLTLVWQGLREMDTSYRVFVHLVDEQGQIVAQSDAEPARWERPTTGWAPGEYVVDTHQLDLPSALPSGPLSLRVGLYEPATGDRLLLADGTDFLILEP